MPSEVLCYNRGCGKTFVPDIVTGQEADGKESCLFHPGAPFFHDAYKGWTCCDKKATDFTEFLNFPGCTKGAHSRVKPEEPESITGNLNKVDDPAPVAVRDALPKALFRPAFEAPCVRVKCNVAASLKAQLEKSPLGAAQKAGAAGSGEVAIGEGCKNGGCQERYSEDASANRSPCVHHPGVPIFHEGLKFWSCCTKRTTDFQSFLAQEGCDTGEHKWVKEEAGGSTAVKCRHDWHQTGSGVTAAVYCKRFDPDNSYVEVNPVRLRIHLFFPEQGGSFDLDVELCGIVEAEKTTCTMYGTKIEVKLTKAEAGGWSRLGEERPSAAELAEKAAAEAAKAEKAEEAPVVIDTLDLDDLELTNTTVTLSKEASGGRTDAEVI